MKKRVVMLSIAAITMFAFGLGMSSNAQGIGGEGDGKKCKNDERCWNGNTVECDEFGDGLECVCYTC